LKTTVLLAGCSIVVFLIWAFFATLDVIAMAPGQIMPVQAVKVIQHIDGGRIAQIDVVDGQKVKKGQVLLRINETEAQAEFQTLNAKYWGLYAKVERLRALIRNRPANFSRVPKQFAELVAEQDHTLKTSRAQITQLEEEIKILTEVSEIRSDLAKEKLATRVQALDAQRSLNLSQAELLRYRRTALDELNISTNELAQAEEQLNKLKDRLDRVEVLAPVDGIVQDLKFRTVGGVVSPGGTLMNVVPDDGNLQAEVRASPTDIGFIRVGQTARLKVGTYDFMRYGTIEGEVTMVSPYSALDEKQNPYFKVIINMPKNYVGDDPSKKIDPGMTVMTDIMTDRQSVLRYLLRPIYIAFKQGMRER
jgi:multidrug efflux pump subunit AcrA (membrane-fusion protein)